jgi:putative ABC transport system permease protein
VILLNSVVFLSIKDITRDKKIVLLVIMLIAFSYMNLTFFPAFLNGLGDTFQNEAINTGTSHITITPRLESGQFYVNSESSIRKKIDLIPGIVGSSSHVRLSGTAFFESKQIGVRIDALMPSEDNIVTTISKKVVKGDFLSDSDDSSIVLGEQISGRRIEDTIGQSGGFGQSVEGLGGIKIGEKVKIKFSNGIEKEYKVIGTASSPGVGTVDQTAYITRKEAEKILNITDKASSILVRLNDKNDADKFKKLILELGIPNVQVKTWKESSTFSGAINETFGTVVFITTLVGIVIVISTIGIVVFINISRKRRIIGVLKAVGMKKKYIMQIFLLESIVFGIAGSILGLIIVYALVFYLNANPIELAIGSLRPALATETALNSIVIIMLSSIIAGYVPSKSASEHDILETIKAVE